MSSPSLSRQREIVSSVFVPNVQPLASNFSTCGSNREGSAARLSRAAACCWRYRSSGRVAVLARALQSDLSILQVIRHERQRTYQSRQRGMGTTNATTNLRTVSPSRSAVSPHVGQSCESYHSISGDFAQPNPITHAYSLPTEAGRNRSFQASVINAIGDRGTNACILPANIRLTRETGSTNYDET